MPVLVDRPHVGVAAHRASTESEVGLYLQGTAATKERCPAVADDLEVRQLSDSGLVADASFTCHCVGVLRLDRASAQTEAVENAEHERRGHEEASGEHLCQLLAFDWRGTQNVFLAIECDPVTVVKPPMTEFVCRGVALNRDRPLRGDEHTADAFRNKGPEQVVEREEGQPEAKVLADAEHIDLLDLVDGELVEQAAGGFGSLDAPLPTPSLRRHDGSLRVLARGRSARCASSSAAWLACRSEKLREAEHLFPVLL